MGPTAAVPTAAISTAAAALYAATAAAVWNASTAPEHLASLSPLHPPLQPSLPASLPGQQLLDPASHAQDFLQLLQHLQAGRGGGGEGEHQDEHEEAEGHRRHGWNQVQPVLMMDS